MTMKYVTFFQFSEDLNIYETLKGDFPAPEKTFFLLNAYDGQTSISKVEDTFDFSRISPEMMGIFNIRIHSIEELRDFVNTNSDYSSTVSALNPDVFHISSPPPFDDLTDHKDRDTVPFENWVWNDVDGHWEPPVKRPRLSNNFSCVWNQERLNWDIEIINQPERKFTGFQLWKPVLRTSSKTYANACSANNYTIKSFEEVTHGTANFDVEITSFKGARDAQEQGRGAFPTIKRHDMAVDIAPVAFITYSELDETYVDVVGTQKIWQTHPQCMAHTAHELFRMIIEWAWAHTELGNNEPMAITCHNVLRALQMPLNVRNDLLSIVPPQPVAKYLLGDRTALVKATTSPECPESFRYWLMDVYRLFYKRFDDEQVHVDYDALPASYPM